MFRLWNCLLMKFFSYEPIPKKIFSEEELKENQKKRTVEEVRPPKKTEKPVQTEEEKLSELLESHVYNEEQLGEIMLAIGAGISYDKILQWQIQKTVLKR